MFVFLHHKEGRRWCRVRLCGNCKEHVGHSSNLHELHRIMCETLTDQAEPVPEDDACREQHLLPATAVIPNDGFDIVLINGTFRCTHGVAVRACFEGDDDYPLIFKLDLRIRDELNREDCMCPAALRTDQAADTETEFPAGRTHGTVVIAVDGETA